MTPPPHPDGEPEAPAHGSARRRLLDAAARLFAARGHENVTIREIAAEAGVRHGGVNYHFKSKRALYLAVLDEHRPPGVDFERRSHTAAAAALAARTPEEARTQLEVLVRALVVRMTHPASSVGIGLMHQEMRRPEGPDDAIFEGVIRPENRAIAHLLSVLAPSITDPTELRLRAFAITAQCLVFRAARPVARRLLEVEEFDGDWVERITRVIVDTTLRGIDEEFGGTRS